MDSQIVEIMVITLGWIIFYTVMILVIDNKLNK